MFFTCIIYSSWELLFFWNDSFCRLRLASAICKMQTVKGSNTSSLFTFVHPHVTHCWPLKRTVFETHSYWPHTSPILLFDPRVLIGHIHSNFPITDTLIFPSHISIHLNQMLYLEDFSETSEHTSTRHRNPKVDHQMINNRRKRLKTCEIFFVVCVFKFLACNQKIKLHGLIRYPESACYGTVSN